MGMATMIMGLYVGCISRRNWWNQMIFCMLLQIQESQKLFKQFLGGNVKKMRWFHRLWDSKIGCI